MKNTVLLALSFSAGALANLAELQAQLPACSVKCLATVAVQFQCSPTDVVCQCRHAEPISDEVAPCMVEAGCSLDEITRTASIVIAMCKEEIEAGRLNATDMAAANTTQVTDAAQETDEPDAASRSLHASLGVAMVAMAVAGAAIL